MSPRNALRQPAADPVVSQGFASGDFDNDAWPIRHFFNRKNLEFVVAQSFSKNFGLYGERIGALHVVSRAPEISSRISGKLVRLQRAQITSPPAFGARIVAKILGDQALYRQWQDDLHRMSGRMKQMRQRLYEELMKRNTPGSWEHILSEVLLWFVRNTTVLLTESADWHVLDDRLVSGSGYGIDREVPCLLTPFRTHFGYRS